MLSETELQKYIEGWRRRIREKEKERRARHARAMATARRLARKLLREEGAARVFVFGTAADAERFRLDSDLDLAVEGLPKERFFKVWAALDRDSEFEVDLVQLELASPALRARILRDGKELRDE